MCIDAAVKESADNSGAMTDLGVCMAGFIIPRMGKSTVKSGGRSGWIGKYPYERLWLVIGRGDILATSCRRGLMASISMQQNNSRPGVAKSRSVHCICADLRGERSLVVA